MNEVRIDYKNKDEIITDKINIVKRFSTFETLALVYGLTKSDIDEVFSLKGFNKDSIIVNEDMKKCVIDAIWEKAKERSWGQYDLFQKYVSQLGLSKRCAVIDIGWKGTM